MDSSSSPPVATASTISLLHDLLLGLGLSETAESFQRELQQRQMPSKPTTALPHRHDESPMREPVPPRASDAESQTVAAPTQSSVRPHRPYAQHVDPSTTAGAAEAEATARLQAMMGEEAHSHPLDLLLVANQTKWPQHVREEGSWWRSSSSSSLSGGTSPGPEEVRHLSNALEAMALCGSVPCAEVDLEAALPALVTSLATLFGASPSAPLIGLCVTVCLLQWQQLVLCEGALEVDMGVGTTTATRAYDNNNNEEDEEAGQGGLSPWSSVDALVPAVMALRAQHQVVESLAVHLSSSDTSSNADAVIVAHVADAVQRRCPAWGARIKALETWLLNRSALQCMESHSATAGSHSSSASSHSSGSSAAPQTGWDALLSDVERVLAALAPSTAPSPPPPPSADPPHAKWEEEEKCADKLPTRSTATPEAVNALRELETVCRVRLLTWMVLSVAECVLCPGAGQRGDAEDVEDKDRHGPRALSCLTLVLAEWATTCARVLRHGACQASSSPVSRLLAHLRVMRSRLLLTLLASPVQTVASSVKLDRTLCTSLLEACGSLLGPLVSTEMDSRLTSQPQQQQQQRHVAVVESVAYGELTSATLSLLRTVETDKGSTDHARCSAEDASEDGDGHGVRQQVLPCRVQLQRALAQQRTLLELQNHPLHFSTSVQLALMDSRTTSRSRTAAVLAACTPARHQLSSPVHSRALNEEEEEEEESHEVGEGEEEYATDAQEHVEPSLSASSEYASAFAEDADDVEEEEEVSGAAESAEATPEDDVLNADDDDEVDEEDDSTTREGDAAAQASSSVEEEEDEEYSSADDCFDSPEDLLKEEVQQVRVSPCRAFLALLTTRGRLAVFALKAPAEFGPGEHLLLDTCLPGLLRHPRWFTACDVSLAFSPDSRFLAASVQHQPMLTPKEARTAPYVAEATGEVCLFSLHTCPPVRPRRDQPLSEKSKSKSSSYSSSVWRTDLTECRLYQRCAIAESPIQETQWLDTRVWRSPTELLWRHAQGEASVAGLSPTAAATRHSEHTQLQRLWKQYAIDGTVESEAAAWRLSAMAHLAAFQCLSSTRGTDIYRWEPASGVVVQRITMRSAIGGFVFSALMGGLYVIDDACHLMLINATNEAEDVSYGGAQGKARVVVVGDRGLPQSPRLLMSEEEATAEAHEAELNPLADKARPAAFFTGLRIVRFRASRPAWEKATGGERRAAPGTTTTETETETETEAHRQAAAVTAPLGLALPASVWETLQHTGGVARAVASRGAARVGRLLLRRRLSTPHAVAPTSATVVIDTDGGLGGVVGEKTTMDTGGAGPQAPPPQHQYVGDASDSDSVLSGSESDADEAAQREARRADGVFWFFRREASAAPATDQTRRPRARSPRARRRRASSRRWTRSHSPPAENAAATTRSAGVTAPAAWFPSDACVMFADVGSALCHRAGLSKVRHDSRIGVGGPLYNMLSMQLSGEPRWEAPATREPSAVATRQTGRDEEDVATAHARRRFSRRCVALYLTTARQRLAEWREDWDAAPSRTTATAASPTRAASSPPREKRLPADTALAALMRLAMETTYYVDVLHHEADAAQRQKEEKEASRPASRAHAGSVRVVTGTGLAPSSANGRYLCVMAAVGPYRQYTERLLPLKYQPGLYACLVFDTYHSHVVRVIPVCPTLPSPHSPFTTNAVVITHKETIKEPLYCLPCSVTTLHTADAGSSGSSSGSSGDDDERLLVTIGGLAHEVYVFDALSGDRLQVVTLGTQARFVESALRELKGPAPTLVSASDSTAADARRDDQAAEDARHPGVAEERVTLTELLHSVDQWDLRLPEGAGSVRDPRKKPSSVGVREEGPTPSLTGITTSSEEEDGDSAACHPSILLEAATHALCAAECAPHRQRAAAAAAAATQGSAAQSHMDVALLVAMVTQQPRADPFVSAPAGAFSSSSGEDEEVGEEGTRARSAATFFLEADAKRVAAVAASPSHEARRRTVLDALLSACPPPVVWHAYRHLFSVSPLTAPRSLTRADAVHDVHAVRTFLGVFGGGNPRLSLLACAGADTAATSEARAGPEPSPATIKASTTTGGSAVRWGPFQEPPFAALAPDVRQLIHSHAVQLLMTPAGATPAYVGNEEAEAAPYLVSAASARRTRAREAGLYSHQDQLRVGAVNSIAMWSEAVWVAGRGLEARLVLVAATETGQLTVVGGPLERYASAL